MFIFVCRIANKLKVNKYLKKYLTTLLHSKKIYSDNDIDEGYNKLNAINKNPQNSCIRRSKRIINKKNDLSIIIPCFNMENYIEDCLNSVINQKTEYKFHIIVINDGSTDLTPIILEKYKSVKNLTIVNQENKGFSGARNTGLDLVDSKYIMFVDSDDKLLPLAIDSLLRNAYKYDADIVEGGYNLFQNNKILKTFNHKFYVGEKWFNILYGYPWGKIYKSELFSQIKFPEQYWFEDTINIFILYPMASIFCTIPNIVYDYRLNHKGITTSSIKKIKSIDSTWITEQLIKDRITLKMPINQDFYELILAQFTTNFRRICRIKHPNVKELTFCASVKILNTYFKDFNTKNPLLKDLEVSIRNRDYKTYYIYCLL